VSVTGAHAIPASRFTPLYAKLIGHEVKLSDMPASPTPSRPTTAAPAIC
jgi:hypothetical protein